MTTEAQKFYGAACTMQNAPMLTKAVHYLDMALRAETDSKREMAFKAAVKAEADAFKVTA